MKFRLIFLLSVFGLLMGCCTAFWIPAKAEHYIWVFVFVLCAFIISRNAGSKYLLNGFVLGVLDAVWTICLRLYFYNKYVSLNPRIQQENVKLMEQHVRPAIAMLATLPLAALFMGVVQGLFALVLSRFINGSRK